MNIFGLRYIISKEILGYAEKVKVHLKEKILVLD